MILTVWPIPLNPAFMLFDPCRVVAKSLFGFALLLSVIGPIASPTPEPPQPVAIAPAHRTAPMIAHPPKLATYVASISAVAVTPTPTPRVAARRSVAPNPPAYSGTHEDWMRAAGIAENDFQYVEFIVNHEGSWRPCVVNGGAIDCSYAINGGTKAYGVCQAKPGNKMASAGPDWATNPVTQLKWCAEYAQSRYGGWSQSYFAWVSKNWW